MITALAALAGLAMGLLILARRNEGACAVLWNRVLNGMAESVLKQRQRAATTADANSAFTARRVAELRRQGEVLTADRLDAEGRRYAAAAAEERRLLRVLQRLLRARKATPERPLGAGERGSSE